MTQKITTKNQPKATLSNAFSNDMNVSKVINQSYQPLTQRIGTASAQITMKFVFAIACFFAPSVTAFAPALFLVETSRSLAPRDRQKLHLGGSKFFSDDNRNAGNAVGMYGGQGCSILKLGVDIDDAVAQYAKTDTIDSGGGVVDDVEEEDPYVPENSRASAKESYYVNSKKCCQPALPKVLETLHSLLVDWVSGASDEDIKVVLVTQCSLNRLPNLRAHLACWTGKASIAVYLKPTENKVNAINSILLVIKEAKTNAGSNHFDVAVTLVEGCVEGEAYPINYLRNVTLLEAQKQHLQFSASLNQSAVLLVDVDLKPSSNLYKMLHTQHAANCIMKEGKVVVCPAFESTTTACPTNITALKEEVDHGQAEGFHQSHFPQGHGPTEFGTFWEKSLSYPSFLYNNIKEYFWQESYIVRHEDLFEPYVVMASTDVPLCDERFQGYGLNKISHLASISKLKGGEYLVLPGVFLIATAHKCSELWGKIYGDPKSEVNKLNQLALKDLYSDFKKNLQNGHPPVVSESTQARQNFILKELLN